MTESGKFFPRPTPETAVYWQGCHDHTLLIQHCKACGQYQFYPRLICTGCMGDQLEWVAARGRGKVTSYTIVRQAVSKAYAAEVPYVVALIQLEEGPKMMSNIVGCNPESVKTGMSVEVTFEDWSEEITMPKFRPAKA
jgi:hypothetical protein